MQADELKRRFGRRIQDLRERKGLTQEQLAHLIGRSVDTIGNIERGINATRIETAYQLAQALGVGLADLFDIETLKPAAAVAHPALNEIALMLKERDDRTFTQMKELIEVALRLARSG